MHTSSFQRFTVALWALFVSCALTQAQAQSSEQQIGDFLDTQNKLGQFSGSVLVARGDSIVYAGGVGLANRELDVQNRSLTKFRIGSLTKQFTAAAILLLEESDRLKTTDKACAFIDACPEAWKGISIHHLLTHTSGIPNYTSASDFAAHRRWATSPKDLVQRFLDKPLDFPPGTRMVYSNSGYVLLGAIVEKASGADYASYLAQHIFRRLGLLDTGYDRAEVVLKDRASGYSGPTTSLQNAEFMDISLAYAAGGLYSTVVDLHRWNQALYGGRLLSASSLTKMLTPAQNNYAYGLVVADGGTQVLHAGGIYGFSSFMIRTSHPTDGLVVVLANFDQAAVQAVARHLLTLLSSSQAGN